MKTLITLLLICIGINLYSQYRFDIIQQNPNGFTFANNFTIYNNLLFFCATDSTYGHELFKSDGTIDGTVLLKDINQLGDGDPDFLTVFNNKLYFTANDGINGYELWVTDGTSEGTTMFADVNQDGSSSPKYLAVCNDKLYFSANDGLHGRELWISNGTLSGTQLLIDIHPSDSASPVSLMPLTDRLLFWATETGVHSERLWVTNGTLSGTYKIKDIWKSDSHPTESFVLYQSKIYFAADDIVNGRELWVSDGTASGTYMVKDINPFQQSWGGAASYPDHLTIFQDKIYFSALDGYHSEELWISDGTFEGTVLFKEINPQGSSNPYLFTQFNEKLYFYADDGLHGGELWVTDGTQNNTEMLIELNQNTSSFLTALTVNAGKLYFRGFGGQNGESLTRLFVCDGSAEGTYTIQPSNTTNFNPLSTSYKFCSFKNRLFFNAAFTSSKLALWMLTDSTSLNINEDIQKKGILTYPNPTCNKVFIQSEEEVTIVRIHDIIGELVEIWYGSKNLVELDISKFKSGIYIINVTCSNQISYSKKLIKME